MSRTLALDLDGPLIDPRPRQTAVLAHVLKQEGLSVGFTEDDFWALKLQGRSTRTALIDLEVADEVADRIAAGWVEAIEEPRWLAVDKVRPGVRRPLEELANAGTRLVIITARRHPARVRKQAESLGLDRWCADLRVVSPEAAAQEKAQELRGVHASGFIGDTESDGEAAREAGITFAAVAGGQRSAEFLQSCGFDTRESLSAAVHALGFSPCRAIGDNPAPGQL